MQDAQVAKQLQFAHPKRGRLALTWLITGPLNPMQPIWIVGLWFQGQSLHIGIFWLIFWLIGFPSGLAMTLLLPILAKQEKHSTGSLFRAAIFMWLWISLGMILVAAISLSGGEIRQMAEMLGAGILYAAALGLPAALVAAWLTRVIVFRKNLAFSAQPSTP
ncbi:MAG: hypothetical protein KDA53_11430 [Hyphomonas sp.]|nr:hypothetical protein [Hyphomonas sp.]